MADVKWIKLDVEVATDSKIRRIRELPQGNDMALLWIFLLAIAGRCNDNGTVYFTKNIPFSSKDLAKELDFSEKLIKKSLKIFEEFELISVKNDYIYICNWEKWQSIDKLSEIREYNRLAKQKQRQKQKLSDSKNVLDMSLTCQPCQDTEEDIEEDLDIRDIKESNKEKTTCKQVIDLYHSICTSYPIIKGLSESRKKAINARLKAYSIDDFKELFEKAEASAFLKGSNDRNWTATFDWMINDSNMAKILEGNYDIKLQKTNSSKKNNFNPGIKQEYDFEDLENKLLSN